MVSPSRKLTVSFGAFACTLEGFDDPFPVMRQVVDYFQALSAADPSFGAHPERPDTDYLKSLAQESTGGTVEAELSDGGMILRQTSADSVEETLEEVAETGSSEDPADVTEFVAPENGELEPEEPEIEELQIQEPEIEELEVEEPAEEPVSTVQTAVAPVEPPIFERAELETEAERDVIAEAPCADDLMADALAEARFEDIAFPELEEIDEAELKVAASPEADTLALKGAELGDWSEDLIADAQEHGFAPSADPIAEEDAAVARLLKATEERTQAAPELDRTNPLSQLRDTSPDDAFEEESDPFSPEQFMDLQFEDQQPAPEAPAPAQPEPVEVAKLEPEADTITEEEIGELFQALADDTPSEPEAAPAEAAAAEEAPAHTQIITAAATSTSTGKGLRLKFEGDIPKPAGLQAAAPAQPTPEAEPAPLMLTDAQIVRPEPEATPEPSYPKHARPSLSLLNPAPAQPAPEPVQSAHELSSFAASVGAASLPELLEASAAYVTLVSGRSSFSRRDIMTLLDSLGNEEDYSQEARIKSFGKLLRGGSILRTGDGQFTISEQALSSYEHKVGAA